jgi:hypothetical protein
LLKLLAALILSPHMMNPNGTRLRAQLIRARTLHDHAIPNFATILFTARGIIAPATLRVAAHAARAEEAKMP